MNSYKVIIQPEAELDLDEAYEFWEARKKGLGFDLLEEIVEVFDLLEDNPYLFQRIEGEKRRAIAYRFGYNIIYKIKEDCVFVIAILHSSRNPKRWKDRK